MAMDEEDLRRILAGSKDPKAVRMAREQLEMGVPGSKKTRAAKAPAAPKPAPPKSSESSEDKPKGFKQSFKEGFLEATLGKGVAKHFASKSTGAETGAVEGGKQTPSTGDSGRDTVNAVRDLQSDLNAQTSVLRQTNGILESQSKLMSDGFNSLSRQLANLKGAGGDGGGGGSGGGGFADLLDAFGGEKKSGGKAAGGKGALGKLGGLARGAGRLLGKAGPLAALAMGAYDAYQGWGEAGENFDLKEGEEATTGQKLSSSLGGIVSGLSFGLLDKKSVSQGIHSFGNTLSASPQAASRPQPVYDVMGNYTGMEEAPVSEPSPPNLQQEQAGRNNLKDKGDITPDIPAGASPAELKQVREIMAAPVAGATSTAPGAAATQIPSDKTAGMAELSEKEEQKKAEVKKEQDKDNILYSAKQLTINSENVKFNITGNIVFDTAGGVQFLTKAAVGTRAAAPAANPPPVTSSPAGEPPPPQGGASAMPSMPSAPTAPQSAAPVSPSGGGGISAAPVSPSGGGGISAPSAPAAPVSPGGAAERKAARDAGITPGSVAQPVIPAGGYGEATKGTGLSGLLPDSALKPIGQGGHRATPAAADAFAAMRQAARADGINLAVTDSYRSYAAQVDVKRRKPGLAATPGRSNHGWGLAFDMSFGSNRNSKEFKWMQQNAGRFGFSGPLPKPDEPWHWTYTGGKADPGAGPVAGKGEGRPMDEKAKVVAGEPAPQAGGGGGGAAPAGAPDAGGLSTGGGMMGAALTSKETAALVSAAGGGGAKSSEVSSMSSGMATQRDAASMTLPPNEKASAAINTSYSTQPTSGDGGRPTNKVEAALPSAQIFHELFGIGAGGKGSTSFAG